MHRALYRTWRPRTFDEVCGQEHVTDILKYQVATGKTSHAYLFCGSRGTGKTSSAKILAKAVNCLHPVNGNPCNECDACRAIDAGTATDVIEMDAASNNGVDNVRDLKEEIVYMPAELKYRVYIIDEVHMMSASAFNALLKTLEEPPAYVLFILATTELGKLPATIVSRCQRCDFRRIPTEVIMGRLAEIAQAEGMSLTADGARMIARSAQGGMRDAVSLLELCGGAHSEINETLVSTLLGAGDRMTLFRSAEAILHKEYAVLYDTVKEIVMSSGDLAGFFSGLSDVFRDLIIEQTLHDAKAYLDLTNSEDERLKAMTRDVPLSRLYYISKQIEDLQPSLQKTGIARRAAAEIALTRMCDPRLGTTPEAMLARLEELEKEVKRLKVGIPPARISDKSSAETPAGTDVPTLGNLQERLTLSEQDLPDPEAAVLAIAADVDAGKESPVTQEDNASTEVPALEQESSFIGWRDILDEFFSIFPYYRGIFNGAKPSVGKEVLHLRMHSHILVSNFERDARAKEALLRITSDATGKALSRISIERIEGAPAAPKSDEEKF